MFDEYVQLRYHEYNAISNFQNTHLPMNEFLEGNFSQAGKINSAFKQFIAECLSKVTQDRYKHADLDSYIKAELVKLYEEKRKLEQQISAEKEKITAANETIKKALEELEAKYGNDEAGKTIFATRKKAKTVATWILAGAFDNLAGDESKKELYELLYSVYEKMKQDANRSALYQAEDAKLKAELQMQKLNTKLKYRKNGHDSVGNRIKSYENGESKDNILEWMMKDVGQMLGKLDHVHDEIDPRDPETIFTENIVARRILSEKTPLVEKKKALRRFQDKRGLFDRICWQYGERFYGEDRLIKERSRKKEMRELGVYLYSLMTPDERSRIATSDNHPIRQLVKRIEASSLNKTILFPHEYNDLIKEITPPETYETLAGKKKKVKGYGGGPLLSTEEELSEKRAA